MLSRRARRGVRAGAVAWALRRPGGASFAPGGWPARTVPFPPFPIRRMSLGAARRDRRTLAKTAFRFSPGNQPGVTGSRPSSSGPDGTTA